MPRATTTGPSAANRQPRTRAGALLAGVLLCSATWADAAVAPGSADWSTCADVLSAEGVLPGDAVWSCDQTGSDDADTATAANVPASDRSADARLMLVVGISTGAGWLGRSLHKD